MKNRLPILRALVLVLIAMWMTGTLQARGSDLDNLRPPAISGQTSAFSASALGTSFTYQGLLKDGSGNPINNTCDFQFNLYDAASSGSLVGNSPRTVTGVAVTNGTFTVSLDFGANAFDGNARWLQIGVSCPSGGSYTTLSPLQPLTAAPYALYALNADLLDGQHAAAFQKHYQNVLVVAKSGGDFTTITAALNSITDNSYDNPWLIYVAPGVYNEQVTMKWAVDIEGAGESMTRITYTGFSDANTGTVIGAYNAELRFLTVENTGDGATYATAIYNASPMSLTHVTALASGGNNNTGVENYANAPNHDIPVTMTDVTASASNDSPGQSVGVYNYTAATGPGGYVMTVTMTNVNASASISHDTYAIQNRIDSGKMGVTMSGVTASASGGTHNYGVYNKSSSSVMMNVSATISGGASSTNYGVYNYNSSPTMTGVNASVSGGTGSTNAGVYNSSSSPTMTGVNASVSGGTNTFGVYNDSASPIMTNVTAIVSGGTTNYGVYNYSASPAMTNVTATVSGGTTNYGVYNYSSSSWAMTGVNATITGGASSTNYGVYNSFASPAMVKLSAIVTGGAGSSNYGVWNQSSSIMIQDSVISATGGTNDGIHNFASSGTYTVMIDASQITGSTSSIYQTAQYTTKIAVSRLTGSGGQGLGTYICVNSYNGNYAPLGATTCQ